jgi:hypothetical protein
MPPAAITVLAVKIVIRSKSLVLVVLGILCGLVLTRVGPKDREDRVGA